MICNIREAEILLKKGQVIGVPTDTVYGLASLEEYEYKIYQIKGRNRKKKLITMLSNEEELKVDNKLRKEFTKNWPGKVTYIFEEFGRLISYRKPNEPNLQRLLSRENIRLKTTSANISGNEPCLTKEEFEETFPSIPLLEEKIKCEKGNQPSKIIVYNRSKKFKIR